LNPTYDIITDVISGFAKVVLERCGFHHWIAQRISLGEVVSIFLYLLQFPSYDVNNIIMSDADCTPFREPRSVAASFFYHLHNYVVLIIVIIAGFIVCLLWIDACRCNAVTFEMIKILSTKILKSKGRMGACSYVRYLPSLPLIL